LVTDFAESLLSIPEPFMPRLPGFISRWFAAAQTNDPPSEGTAGSGEDIPVTRHDEQFGTLTLQREPRWKRYLGRAKWGDDLVWLDTGATDDEEPDPEALAVASALWADQPGWDARLRDFIVQELLDYRNEAGLEDGDDPLGADELRTRIRLTNVTVYAGGGFTLWYDDDDLFWDHTIEVTGSLHEGLDYAILQG
jgi:hypothetical protein